MELEVARLIVFVAAATAPVTPKSDRRSKLRVSRRDENPHFLNFRRACKGVKAD
jgi:hypothetical protein